MRRGAIAGALVFVGLAGLRIVAPTETGWLMRGDWAWHQGGWHVFRSEPWHWPPGRIASLMFPDGTSIGLTDAIPAVAIPLKLASPLLPSPLQFGAWFALSFVLLGAWAARLARAATPVPAALALTALLAVSLPVLVGRVGHIALTAHWILVAAIAWHVERDEATPAGRWRRWLWLGALASAVHPYLAAMVASLATRGWRARHWPGDGRRRRRR